MENSQWIEKNMHITLLGFSKFHGLKPFKLESLIKLIKEPENKYDNEAIACEMRYFGKVGYVANSTQTVAMGTMSSGRVYDKIDDTYFAKVKFITQNTVIAKILTSEEYNEEMKNPQSDIHYLSDSDD
ncbi:hypothetical protein [Methanobrevibacter sp.]|uniref:hypothetical protein n=1 Tax=Methanobrevibacter sp. TaxID=66852 RepID=UPI0026E0B3B2|nr:hypothetical protein [Methanobrevibacter sp.]MDO5859829.1 hypothetical protein [Methanobrevibacter sp.]